MHGRGVLEDRGDLRHGGSRRGVWIGSGNEQVCNVGAHRRRRQTRLEQRHEIVDVGLGCAPGPPSAEDSAPVVDTQGALRDAPVREPCVVQQRQTRGDRRQGCKGCLPRDERLALDGNLPGECKTLASERHLAQWREALVPHGGDAQRLPADAIALDEIGSQGEQGREGGAGMRRHVGIVPAQGGRVLSVIHRRLA